MCGCKGRKNNGSARVFARSANITEPTVQLKYNGIGAGLLYVGQSTKTRYEVSTGDTLEVYLSDSTGFLKYFQKGRHIFELVDNSQLSLVPEGNSQEVIVLAGDLIIEETPTEQASFQNIAMSEEFVEVTPTSEEIVPVVEEVITPTVSKKKTKVV